MYYPSRQKTSDKLNTTEVMHLEGALELVLANKRA